MEAAGLGFGVASLYGATLDILNRVSSYKEYHHESQAVLARYYGSKARLQEWASGVGIENGKLKEGHNRLLDSPQAAAVVQNTLKCLRQLFDEGEDAKQLASSPSAQHSSQSVDWVIPPELPTIASPNEPPNLSSRRRLAWAVGGKSRLSKIVQNFEGLVTILFNVVPPVDVENTCKAPYLVLIDLGVSKSAVQ